MEEAGSSWLSGPFTTDCGLHGAKLGDESCRLHERGEKEIGTPNPDTGPRRTSMVKERIDLLRSVAKRMVKEKEKKFDPSFRGVLIPAAWCGSRLRRHSRHTTGGGTKTF